MVMASRNPVRPLHPHVHMLIPGFETRVRIPGVDPPLCPSAEERSDVSTRAQCRGQGAEISTRRSAAEQRR